MPTLTVNGQLVEVPAGASVLAAARQLGVHVPTLCFLDGCPHQTSCMLCLVRDTRYARLLPACSAPAEDGMVIETDSPEIHEARRTALELLLSDHLGDCEAPCQRACPAHLHIPRMLRQISAGRWRDALATVKADIVLPAVLGRICPAPCERACRRGRQDAPVSICLLKRLVGDHDLADATPMPSAPAPASGRAVAVVGAGPAGLAAAWHLRLAGHTVTVFDPHAEAGGRLCHDGVPPERLPPAIVAAEAQRIAAAGVRFELGIRVGRDLSLAQLRQRFAAMVLAVGQGAPADLAWTEAELSPHGIRADPATLRTSQPDQFAAGACVHPTKAAVNSLAAGKAAAHAADLFLRGQPVTGVPRPFNCHLGPLLDGEMATFLADADAGPRREPESLAAGFAPADAQAEARRCLHCDCRKADGCALRQHATAYGAKQGRHAPASRRAVELVREHPEVLYEPGKCIRCGLCIALADAARARPGLAFTGRGYDVRVSVPFNEPLAVGLGELAARCVAACPTAALAWRHAPEEVPPCAPSPRG